ncbi:MAG: prepilin-type N-terminal cleavage/methylation domain-containing protein [Gemmatimonadaceae bacterium]|nr:prepilin-type N-terminal cleavage/methylation domain-containing protein [Gemmatimonadaceae bacterium]
MRAFPVRSERSTALRPRWVRRGISLLEVMVALTILGTSLIGMAEYGRRYARSNANSMLLNNALDLASARVERVKAERNYTSMDSLATTENTISGYPNYRRVTTIVQTLSAQYAYKTVTVTITHPAMPTPVKKTTAIARF